MQNGKPRITLFLIMTMFFWMSLYSYQPQLSVYCGLLGASSAFTGTILSAYGFVQMFLRVPLGLISDRFRKRKLFVAAGGVVAAVGAFGMYLSPSPGWLLVFRAMAGVAASSWVTFSVLYAAYFGEGESARAMPRLLVFNNGGQLLGMLGGGLIAQFLEVRACFLLAGLLAVVASVLAMNITEKVADKPGIIDLRELFGVLKNRTLLQMSLLALLSQTLHHGGSFGFNPRLAAEMGASPIGVACMSAAMSGGSMTGAWCLSKFLVRRFGARRCMLTAPLAYGLLMILMPLLSVNVPMLIFFQLLIGFASGTNFSLLMGTAITEIEPRRQGLAMGIFQTIYAFGMFIGPLIMGFLIDSLSLRTTISVMGIVGLLEFVLALFVIPEDLKE